jgi:hypothetical protein
MLIISNSDILTSPKSVSKFKKRPAVSIIQIYGCCRDFYFVALRIVRAAVAHEGVEKKSHRPSVRIIQTSNPSISTAAVIISSSVGENGYVRIIHASHGFGGAAALSEGQ